MTRKHVRLYKVLLLLCGVGVSTTLVLFALRENVSYFRTPTDILSGHFPEQKNGHSFRLGGLVEKGSLSHQGHAILFQLSDLKNHIQVHYDGVVPDLFREGQGVIAEGKMGGDNTFEATTLLAKHDEKYMPPEVAKELKDSGHTSPGQTP